MVGRACPHGDDEAEEGACHVIRARGRVEREGREDLREETEGALDMSLVLRTLRGRADADRVAERGVDLRRVIGRLVVEQERDRRRARRGHAIAERIDDGGAVFIVAHRRPNEGASVRVHVELEVEHEAIPIHDDGHLHPVTDPLRTREVRAKRAAQRELVRAASDAASRLALPVGVENAAHEIAAEGHVEIAADVFTEVEKRPLPA